LLDTGAEVSAVSTFLATELRLPTVKRPEHAVQSSTGARVRGPWVRAATVTAATLVANDVPLLVLPDQILSTVPGLLGSDLLQNSIVDLRIPNNDVFCRNNAPRPTEMLTTVRRRRTVLAVRVRVGTIDVDAIVDTGAQRTIGNAALRRRLGLEDTTGPVIAVSSGGGALRGEEIDSPALHLGSLHGVPQPLIYANLPVFATWDLVERPSLLLGMDWLGRLATLVIDYRSRRVAISHCSPLVSGRKSA
jgi:predicted aspartyl protease